MKHYFFILSLMILQTVSLSISAQVRTLYISPKGNDKAAGTISAPLRTIQKAIQRAEESSENEPVEIVLREGCYEQRQTLEIINRGNLTIRPYRQERAVISGGKRLTSKAFKRVNDREILSRLQPQVRKQIYEINFKNLQDDLAGLHASGFGRPTIPAWTQVFIDNHTLHIARWPNDSTVAIGKIKQSGIGPKGNNEPYPIFGYNENRPSAWKDTRQMWISGYFAHGYADDMIKVEKIDTLNKYVHTAQHTVYGFMTGKPWRQWFALNLVEELDLPGEYVIDTDRQKIFFYPPTEKPKTSHISLLEGPILAIENVDNVIVEGITFEYGRSIAVYMENTNHVRIKDCVVRNMGGTGIVIGKGSSENTQESEVPAGNKKGGEPVSRRIGDLLGKIYDDILYNRKGGTDNGIINCQIYNVGAGGINMGGGDRATLTPGGNFVENCRIHNYNNIEKSYRPGIWIDGVGNKISQCDIYNAPSMAIYFHGNDHLIELCKIINVCTEINDQGAIYYGRDPSEQGNVIRYCYFNNLGAEHLVSATYHDDGACGTKVYGNIYHNSGTTPALIGGGHDNHYMYNLFIECPRAIHLDNRMQNWGKGMVAPNGVIDQRLKTVRHKEPPYSTRYPNLTDYWESNPAYPSGNVIEGNLFYKIDNALKGQSQWGEFYNNWTTDQDPGFVNPENPLEGLKPDALLYKRINGFPKLPFDKIGCKLPE